MNFIICTTFREFDKSKNDKIQRLFLERIAKEKENRVKLIVTTFGEKNVVSALNEYDIDFEIFEERSDKYRFSLTKVFLNGLLWASNSKSFIIWTTCDIIFAENFFSTIVEQTLKINLPISVISHPHLIFESIDDLRNGNSLIYGPNDGIDFVGFSYSGITDKFITYVKNYFFEDWGIFEHFLVALAEKFKFYNVNLYFESHVSKITNDREVNSEDENYFLKSLNKNRPVFHNFLKESNLSHHYESLVFCNLKYHIPGVFRQLEYRLKFTKIYFKFFKFFFKTLIFNKQI